ncbi:MAG: hypothetical protein AB1Z98_39065, partial [Nannocystaceae bacterium]
LAIAQARATVTQQRRGTAPRRDAATLVPTLPYSTRAEGLAYVALVDTADSTTPAPPGLPRLPAYNSEPRHQHGLMMGAVVEAARCPYQTPQCVSRQFYAQAFPYDDSSVEPLPSGGQRGSLGSLASAIGEVVARHAALPDSKSSPLVINLSVGWDLDHGGVLPAKHQDLLATPDASVPATVQAVHHALAWAACRGALSVAASGNARGSTCKQRGIMAPAAWEALPVLEASACDYFAPGLSGGSATARLVHGVGGLDGDDRPIANTRLRSLPSRAVYAHQATEHVDRFSPKPPPVLPHSQPWTGTSIAAAGLSAIAAQVWSFDPALDATSVMATIDQAGVPVAVDRRWQAKSVRPRSSIRRIDAHAVMDLVDAARNPYVVRTASKDPVSVTIISQTIAAGTTTTIDPIALVPDPSATGCSDLTVQGMRTSTAVEQPRASHLSDVSRPQPNVPICPTCPIVKKPPPNNTGGSSPPVGPEYTLYLELAGEFGTSGTGLVVDQPVLELYDPGTNTSLQVALGPLVLSTSPQELELSTYALSPSGSGQTSPSLAQWLDDHPDVTSARLHLRVDEDGSGPRAAQVTTAVIDVVRAP